MSVFLTSINHRSFVWQLSALCFVLGLILSASWVTATQINRQGVARPREGFVYGNGSQVAADSIKQREDENKKLRDTNTELENKLAKGTSAASTLNKELQDNKVFAGLTEITGQGVQVTLTDSARRPDVPSDPLKLTSLIHDADIVLVVNELKAAGAEAIAVNGQRVLAMSPIRCVGPVVHVNGVPASPPYVIQAVGEPEVLFGAMNLPGGVLEQLRNFDPAMVRVDKKKRLLLPAYAGSTEMRFAHPVKASSGDKVASASKETNP